MAKSIRRRQQSAGRRRPRVGSRPADSSEYHDQTTANIDRGLPPGVRKSSATAAGDGHPASANQPGTARAATAKSGHRSPGRRFSARNPRRSQCHAHPPRGARKYRLNCVLSIVYGRSPRSKKQKRWDKFDKSETLIQSNPFVSTTQHRPPRPETRGKPAETTQNPAKTSKNPQNPAKPRT